MSTLSAVLPHSFDLVLEATLYDRWGQKCFGFAPKNRAGATRTARLHSKRLPRRASRHEVLRRFERPSEPKPYRAIPETYLFQVQNSQLSAVE